MDVLDDAGELITAPEIEAKLRYIDAYCHQQGAGPGVGSLTGGRREPWAKVGATSL